MAYCILCGRVWQLIWVRTYWHWQLLLHEATNETPQFAPYMHAWSGFWANPDWIAFIVGDEFLFNNRADTLPHSLDPAGLMLESYARHYSPNFATNRHMKSLVHGGEPGVNPIHHLTQSWRFSTAFKLRNGAAVLSPDVAQPVACFSTDNRNECDENLGFRFLLSVKMKLREIVLAI